MRKQYYFRESERGLLAWDVDRLVELSRELPRKEVRISDIRGLDHDWSDDLAGHMLLIDEADLDFPIILAADGRVMDGRHRVAKAIREGRTTIHAVQFVNDPEPDYAGRDPDELPY
ncbi:MAG TPA: hypothetical protein VL284_08895 [Thermoanaerobaculia bacterium]|nr:hypothetical protein [Thermoanaerobaculia bacterium]